VERDKGKKGKISKKRKKGKKGSKKGKKKKDKDLTPDRTTESLFEEMILNGIIKQYPKVGILTTKRTFPNVEAVLIVADCYVFKQFYKSI
jgi:hypothetical protein